jgi:hypothetical protein
VNILMLGRWLPVPRRARDVSRELRFARRLAREHQLTLAFTTDEPDPSGAISALRSEFPDLEFTVAPRGWRCLTSTLSLATGGSCTLAYFRSPALSTRLADRVNATRFDLVFASASSMLQYALAIDPTIPLVVDFADIDSQWWLRQASRRSDPGAAFYRTEAARLRLAEARAASRARRSIVASPQAGRALLSMTDAASVGLIQSGVELDPEPKAVSAAHAAPTVVVFAPARGPDGSDPAGLPSLAVAVQARVPAARFVLAADRATPGCGRWPEGPGAESAPGEDSLRSALRGAAVALVLDASPWGPSPEILAAMAAGVPVVTTSRGVEGIRARPARDLFVEDEEAGVARRVVELIRAPELRASMAASAVSLLETRYSWESAAERVAALVAEVGATCPAPRAMAQAVNPLAAAASVP